MNKSLIALTVALMLPAGFALAEPQAIIPPSQQLADAPGQEQQSTENQSFRAYQQNINGNVAVPTTGIYDQEDAFSGPHGFPLEGWRQIQETPSEN